ncbi:amino acid permease, partial [Streptomyces brasiliscabiei]|uniref:amino acid permease n=1 Tax=Streptomyces brasiliscabiei TaxID=2736302 RepID=UPI003014C5BC
FLILAGVAAFSPAVPDVAHPTSWTGFGRGLILTLFAFTGMETALGASGEVSAPSRTVPRALFAAMLFILALYLGAQFGAGHMLGAALPASQ